MRGRKACVSLRQVCRRAARGEGERARISLHRVCRRAAKRARDCRHSMRQRAAWEGARISPQWGCGRAAREARVSPPERCVRAAGRERGGEGRRKKGPRASARPKPSKLNRPRRRRGERKREEGGKGGGEKTLGRGQDARSWATLPEERDPASRTRGSNRSLPARSSPCAPWGRLHSGGCQWAGAAIRCSVLRWRCR